MLYGLHLAKLVGDEFYDQMGYLLGDLFCDQFDYTLSIVGWVEVSTFVAQTGVCFYRKGSIFSQSLIFALFCNLKFIVHFDFLTNH